MGLLVEYQSGQRASEARSSTSGGRWVNVVSHLDARYGGLSAVVPRLVSSIVATTPFTVDLAAFCVPGEIFSETDYPGISISRWPASRLAWLKRRELTLDFSHQLKDLDGVHIHGLWEQSTTAAVHAARALRKPYILSAHGMLDPWALRNKRLKKVIYAALAEHANVRGAACLHALTHAEVQDYRRFGSTGPIAVIPNGVAIPEQTDPHLFLENFPSLGGTRIVLFLGRIHFKKGLDILVESWAAIAKRWPDARLVLAGPDFEGTRAKIEALVSGHKLNDSVLFTGMLRDEMKWSALAAAESFILPSYSEGLSVSTLEAMGMGRPVIITEQCNLPDVTRFQAGWIIQSNSAAITESLNELLQNSSAINREVGERGRNLVRQRYNWPSVARQMSEVYRWVQSGAAPHSAPASVEFFGS